MEVKLLGLTSQEYFEKQVEICAAAGKLSRMPGTVFDAVDSMNDYDKALKFVNRVIGMGHTSTIDHDYMVFALSGVSPIVEQTLIEERFASFTVKSRREVDFSKVGYCIPDFHDENGNVLESNKELQKKYCEHMQKLFNSYSIFVDAGIKKEDARFILPYSFHGEIIMGLDGTSLARMINYLTKSDLSKIDELKLLGNKLYEIAKTRAPYIETLINKDETLEFSNKLLKKIVPNKTYAILDNPVLLSATPDIDKTIFLNAIMREFSLTGDEALKIYEENIKNDAELQSKLMKEIFKDPNHDDLKQINMRFNFSVPYAILTHYTRHRRLSLSIPKFAPIKDLTKYLIPPAIKNNSKLKELFENLYRENKKIYDEFKDLGIRGEDLVYFILSGNMINVVINFDGEAFRWICRLRECTKAQWCIRENVTKMHQEINKISTYYSANLGPDCVTKHLCGEGKESCGRINTILASLKEEINN